MPPLVAGAIHWLFARRFGWHDWRIHRGSVVHLAYGRNVQPVQRCAICKKERVYVNGYWMYILP